MDLNQLFFLNVSIIMRIHVCMAFSHVHVPVPDLEKTSFLQNRLIECTAKCNMFTVVLQYWSKVIE